MVVLAGAAIAAAVGWLLTRKGMPLGELPDQLASMGHGLAEMITDGASDVGTMIANNIYLSPNFRLRELLVSSTADSLGLENVPTPAAVVELRKLARDVLEPVREIVGAPLRITSGYRSAAVNAALAERGYQPSATSDHLTGRAADFIPLGVSAEDAYHAIRERIGDLPIDQLIFYRGLGHIHVGTRSSPRRMAWIQD